MKQLIQKLTLTVTTLAVALAFGATSQAAGLGTDNANQPDYDDGWQPGDDGAASGDAFGPWTLNGSTGTGFFVGNSATTLASGDPPTLGADINVNGESWGIFGEGDGSLATADRNFTDGPLLEGQTFSLQLAVNFRNGFKGMNLRDGGGTIFTFNIGGDDYVVFDAATGNGSIGNSYDINTAFTLTFTQTSPGGGNWTIVRSGGISDSDSGTYNGAPDNFRLYIGSTEVGGANNLFANNLSIVPEPSTYVMVGLGLLGLLALRRRKP